MTIDDSESEDENHFVGNRYNHDDSDSDSDIDFYNLPSVGTKRKFCSSLSSSGFTWTEYCENLNDLTILKNIKVHILFLINEVTIVP